MNCNYVAHNDTPTNIVLLFCLPTSQIFKVFFSPSSFLLQLPELHYSTDKTTLDEVGKAFSVLPRTSQAVVRVGRTVTFFLELLICFFLFLSSFTCAIILIIHIYQKAGLNNLLFSITRSTLCSLISSERKVTKLITHAILAHIYQHIDIGTPR